MVLDRAKRIVFADPLDPETDLGAVVSADAAALFEKRVNDAAEEGADALYQPQRRGASLPPIVLGRDSQSSESVMRETLGPVNPIIRAPNDDTATIALSKSDDFGLLAGLCANDGSRMHHYISGLNIGTVKKYGRRQVSRTEMAPFGGIKDSGLGYKEDVIEAMKGDTNAKTFSLPWG